MTTFCSRQLGQAPGCISIIQEYLSSNSVYRHLLFIIFSVVQLSNNTVHSTRPQLILSFIMTNKRKALHSDISLCSLITRKLREGAGGGGETIDILSFYQKMFLESGLIFCYAVLLYKSGIPLRKKKKKKKRT